MEINKKSEHVPVKSNKDKTTKEVINKLDTNAESSKMKSLSEIQDPVRIKTEVAYKKS